MKIPTVWKIRIILIVLVLTFVVTERQIERMGDSYQVALPVLGLACSLTSGQAVDYLVRYVVQQSVVSGSKAALGKVEINRRPRGGYHGMPSGHTSASFYGASYLARSCVGGNVWMQSVVFLTAGYV
ncbi:MAG: phosphoesterase, partial [Paracoccaceae bacterium]